MKHLLKRLFQPRRYICELEDLIKHAWIHDGYPDCGRQQITTRQKEIYDRIKHEPWSFE